MKRKGNNWRKEDKEMMKRGQKYKKRNERDKKKKIIKRLIEWKDVKQKERREEGSTRTRRER